MTARLNLRVPKGDTIPKPLRDILDERVIAGVHFEQDMRECDFMVTTAALSAPLERLAARMGGMVCVLPEAGEWLSGVILRRIEAGRDVWVYFKGGEMILCAECTVASNKWLDSSPTIVDPGISIARVVGGGREVANCIERRTARYEKWRQLVRRQMAGIADICRREHQAEEEEANAA